MTELRSPLFDGEKVWEGACVQIKDGVTPCAPAQCGEGSLLPGLMDAHAHIETSSHIAAMLRSGIWNGKR